MDIPHTPLSMPDDIRLPLFVYGALKPGMPAFEQIKDYIKNPPCSSRVCGALYVRDGLPLLFQDNTSHYVEGFLLDWTFGKNDHAYQTVCEFEPKEHYKWTKTTTFSGIQVNVLLGRYFANGNPQKLENSSCWKISDDPAFGGGLAAVQEIVDEIPVSKQGDPLRRFFRAQMAYLLLWSILERLTTLCFGASMPPTQRVNKLHSLPGMTELIAKHIRRKARVFDSRNPKQKFDLDANTPQNCISYYYQVRSNLSHRGKAVFNEIDVVESSLVELLLITHDYVQSLRE